MPLQLHVSPQGSDLWHGHLPEPTPENNDGPLASLDGARKRVLQLRAQHAVSGEVEILVHPGRYTLATPLRFGPDDGPMTFKRIGDGEVIIDGGTAITDWELTEVHGHRAWVADVEGLLTRLDQPRSLFVNGERRDRARYPQEGWLTIEDAPDVPQEFELFDGASRFIVRDGDFQADWVNPSDIEAVINHLWIEERMPVKQYDAKRRMIHSTHRSIFTLRNKEWMGDSPCAKLFWDNVFEAMTVPGQWYLDRQAGRLYYLALEDETPETCDVRLAALTQLVRIHGDETRPAGHIRFEGLTFFGTDWTPSEGWGRWWDPELPPEQWAHKDSFNHFTGNNLNTQLRKKGMSFAAMPQAAHDLPGAVSLEFAKHCAFDACRFAGLGFYAVDVRRGCKHIRISQSAFDDLGAGGVKIDGSDATGPPLGRTSHIHVGDCTMTRCGRIYPSAVGVGILHASHNTVEHNDISDQFYTAISVGWSWGYEETVCEQNLIQYNHLHHIGQGRLSDMGGIYTLGRQPGTILRGNHIHHIHSGHYGGWGIYLDEGSSFIRVEGNLVHHTGSQGLNEHWGRQNVVTDNVLALCGTQAIQLCREAHGGETQYPPPGCLFMRNVVLVDGGAVFHDAMNYLETGFLRSDLNLYWDQSQPNGPTVWNYEPWEIYADLEAKQLGLDETRALGLDLHSRVANPGFKDAANEDFTVTQDSPLHLMGIPAPSAAKAGPREEASTWRPVLQAQPSTSQDMQFTD